MTKNIKKTDKKEKADDKKVLKKKNTVKKKNARKTGKKMGRPTVMTAEIIGKLENAYLINANDTQASFLAGISRDTLRKYKNENPDFVERIEMLKSSTGIKAKKKIYESVAESYGNSMDYLKRTESEVYGDKIKKDVDIDFNKVSDEEKEKISNIEDEIFG